MTRPFFVLGSIAALLPGALTAQTSAPVALQVVVDTSPLSSTGGATAKLSFDVERDLDEAYSIRLELYVDERSILRRDHAPPKSTRTWRTGEKVVYDLPLSFRTGDLALAADTNVTLRAGLLDADGEVVPLAGGQRNRDNLVVVGSFAFPGMGSAAIDGAAVDAAIEAARAAARAGRPGEAWERVEFVFRRTEDYGFKAKLRDALLAIGKFDPPEPTFEEQAIVAGRIAGERRRYLRLVSSRMLAQGELHGALLILDTIGGTLQDDVDRAVLGALDDAERVTRDRDDIVARITRSPTQAQEDAARAWIEKLGASKRLLEKARTLAQSGERAVARQLFHHLGHSGDDAATRAAGAEARDALDTAWLADVPPEQRSRAEREMNHPAWARTECVPSHRFLLLGPRTLVRGIPDDSALAFDIAYLYLTDLFGRVPNPGGDRVTVYFKELWEFGGGVGGGKTIDIGNADPDARQTRVDTKLLYHELTHCVDDTRPVYHGFREGLADFGATFVDAELGNRGRARADIGMHFRAFQQDYLQRDLEYWRIPNYGPSAGFLLHFMTEYGKAAHGYRWELYRRFFRAYRDCPVNDSRAQNIARAFGHHLVEVFGEGAFVDLQRFRWPLRDSDLEAIRLEHEAAHDRRAADADRFAEFEGSPIPRDVLAGDLLLGRRPTPTDLEQKLGILEHWHVIGPFRKDRVRPDGFVFPPEFEVDFDQRYPLRDNTATWREPGPRPPVLRDDDGWLVFDYSYMDDTAIYALTHVTVNDAVEAWAWVRADDDLTLFVEDRLVGKYEFAAGPTGPWAPGRAHLPDAIRFPIELRKGRNKLLLKVYNSQGASGCSLAITHRDGTPIAGLVSDASPPDRVSTRVEASDPKRWHKRTALRFRGGGDARKLEAKVGKFTVRQNALVGVATDGAVEWRKYTVRPGFPKDSPSNLGWLPERATEELDEFWLRVGLDCRDQPPKACLIFQGDGSRDALSGWTLVLQPDHGRGEFRIRVERYDRLVYESDWVGVDRENSTPLDLLYENRRLTAWFGDHELLGQVPIRPIPDRTRIGFAHWGDGTRITEVELRVPRRTR